MNHQVKDFLEKNWDAMTVQPGRIIHFQGTTEAFSLLKDFFRTKFRFELPLYDMRSPADLLRPYAPFLDVLRSCHPGSDGWGPILDQAGLLTYHKPLFSAFLNRQPIPDKPTSFWEEIPYERRRLKEGLIRLLVLSSYRFPVVFAVANAQKIAPDSLEVLRSLVQGPSFQGLILLHFHEDTLKLTGPLPDHIQDYFFEIGVSDTLFPLEEGLNDWALGAPPAVEPETLRKTLSECASFLSFESGEETARIWRENPPTNDEDLALLTFYEGFFLQHSESRKTVEASLNLEESARKFQEVLKIPAEGFWTAEALFQASQIAIEQLDYPTAQAYVHQAVKKSSQLGLRFLEARALILEHIISQRLGQNDTWEGFRRAVNLFDRENQVQFLIFALWNYAPADRLLETYEENGGCVDRAIALATQIGQDYALSTAYHLKGILASQIQGESQAFPFYEKGLQVRQKLGQPLPVIRIQNGLAFSLLNQADFGQAFRYIKRAIILLDGIRDFFEISLTLFNLAMVYFFGRHYEKALNLIQRVLRIMQVLDLKHLVFHHLTDVHLFRAFCAFKLGDDLRALGMVHALEKDEDRLNHFNLPVYHALRALMAEREGRIADFEKLMSRAYFSMPGDKGTRQRLGPFLALEEAGAFLRRAMPSKAQEALARFPVSPPENLQYPYWYKRLWEEGTLPDAFAFPPLEVNLEALVELARQEKKLRQFYKNLKDIRFVNQTMADLELLNEPQELAQRLVENLGAQFPTVLSFFWTQKSGHWKSEACWPVSSRPGAPESWLDEKGSSRLIYPHAAGPEGPQNQEPWSSAIVIPIRNDDQTAGLWVTLTKSSPLLSTEDLEIFRILGRYLSARLG